MNAPHITDETHTTRKIEVRSGDVKIVVITTDGKVTKTILMVKQIIGKVEIWKDYLISGPDALDNLSGVVSEAAKILNKGGK